MIENEKNIKNMLKRGQMASYEAILFVIGEYVVSEWNVTDENDKPLAINGDNLLLVLGSVPNLKEFIDLLLTEFNSAMTEFTNMVEDLKKKSSNATNGKKSAKN